MQGFLRKIPLSENDKTKRSFLAGWNDHYWEHSEGRRRNLGEASGEGKRVETCRMCSWERDVEAPKEE